MPVARAWLNTLGAVALVASATTLNAAPVQLFFETFDGVDFDGVHGSDPRVFGVPTTDGSSDGSDATIGDADNDWHAARFEKADGGAPYQDVGVQEFGGGSNTTPVGIVEDDAGLIIPISTSGFTNVQLGFDWRTFLAETTDRLVVGYFVGNLLDVISPSLHDAATRSFDLRTAADGGSDGAWNWDGWIELLRAEPSTSFTTSLFDLVGAENKSQVWLAFWMDDGEGDFGKIDNILVTGMVVPLPAPLALLVSGLLGLALLRRRAH